MHFILANIVIVYFLIGNNLFAKDIETYCKSLIDKESILKCFDDEIDKLLQDRKKELDKLDVIKEQTPKRGIWKKIELVDPVDQQKGIYVYSKSDDGQGILALVCKENKLSIFFEGAKKLQALPELKITIDKNVFIKDGWEAEGDKTLINHNRAAEIIDQLIFGSRVTLFVNTMTGLYIENSFDLSGSELFFNELVNRCKE